eukprot:TRINITY_DN10010_c0_g1_i1.p1 TRINITY_DN10010_c0_g1~~TRINITY_DN10010_c0_g1_i1.p1  ORF type:complete len:450 (+),score=113.87 TRINITY_DN10010_c0_g1_i1:127-1350(+)
MEKDHAHYLGALNACTYVISTHKSTKEGAPGQGTEELQLALRLGFRLIGNLCRFWWMHGHTKKVLPTVKYLFSSEASAYFHIIEKDHKLTGDAYYGLGMLYYSIADYEESERYYEMGLKDYERIKDRRGEADCLNGKGMVHRETKKYETAEVLHRKSLAIYKEEKDLWGWAHALSNLGVVLYRSGNEEQAWGYHEQALKIRKSIKDELGIGSSLGNLAANHLKCKDFEKAKPLYEEALEIRVKLGDTWGVAGAHVILGRIELELKNFPEALAHFSESLKGFYEVGDTLGFAETTEGIAYLKYHLRMYQEAAVLTGITTKTRGIISAPIPDSHLRAWIELIQQLESVLQEQYQSCYNKGMNLDPEEARKYAQKVLLNIDVQESPYNYKPLIGLALLPAFYLLWRYYKK